MGPNKTSVAGKSRCATLAWGKARIARRGQGGFPEAAPSAREKHARSPRPAASGLAWRRPPGTARARCTRQPGGNGAAALRGFPGPGARDAAELPAPLPGSLTFLEARALPASGGRSPEHVRGGLRGPCGNPEPRASAGGATQPGFSPSRRPLPSCPGGREETAKHPPPTAAAAAASLAADLRARLPHLPSRGPGVGMAGLGRGAVTSRRATRAYRQRGMQGPRR